MAGARVSMEVGNDGVALVTFSNPPVNALEITTCMKIKEIYDEVIRRNDVKAIVITGANGKFSSGFDLKLIKLVQETGDLSILPKSFATQLINTIEDSPKPFVAALQGFAHGSGLELAMGCHARISATKVQLVMPELLFGLIPGLGGTQRLPRLVGLMKAIEMILLSKPIGSEEGMELGLIDAVVPPQDLLKVSRMWALDIAEGRKPLVRSLHMTDKLGSLSEVREILMIAIQKAKQTARNMPQYQACLDVIEEGIIHGGYTGVLREEKNFKELLLSETSKGLLHMFLAQNLTSKIPGVRDAGLKPRRMKKVAVIGGGLMGSGIATALLLSNIHIVLNESNVEFLAKGIQSIQGNIRGLVTKGKLENEKAEKALSLLQGELDYTEFRDVDMVIEAAVGDVSLKQTIFSQLEKACPSNCILATNTSTTDLNIIGEKANSQERIVGAHFFSLIDSPVHMTPLLEIARTNKTSAQVILDLIAFARAIRKVPIVVGNCTGYALNRTFFPYFQSADLLANLGVDIFRIDRVVSDLGLPMGPFQLQDLAGYGNALAVAKEFQAAFPDHSFRSPLVELLVKHGRNGKINGKGYYTYEKGSKPQPDPSVLPIIEESRRMTNIMPGEKPISVSDQDILGMILFPVVNEACRVLEDRVVVRASDLDVASVLGMNFPSYRGGILFWADAVGPNHIYNSLKKWSNLYGSFFKPSQFLEKRVANGLLLVSGYWLEHHLNSLIAFCNHVNYVL